MYVLTIKHVGCQDHVLFEEGQDHTNTNYLIEEKCFTPIRDVDVDRLAIKLLLGPYLRSRMDDLFRMERKRERERDQERDRDGGVVVLEQRGRTNGVRVTTWKIPSLTVSVTIHN